MTETISFITQSLRAYYPANEISSFIRLIVTEVTQIEYHQIILCKDKKLSVSETEQIHEIVSRLQQYEPIQYILGKTSFYGLELETNPSVLIPRPETEELVDIVIRDHKNKPLKIIDMGTGSGCIAIALAKHLPFAEVSAMDISPEAIHIARKNAEKNQVTINFIHDNILNISNPSIKEKVAMFDLIVSNPPYVLKKEKQVMEQNVLKYEPHLALFVPDDNALVFYNAIAEFGKNQLRENGELYFEINPLCSAKLVSLLEEKGYRDTEVIKDISGKERMIKTKR